MRYTDKVETHNEGTPLETTELISNVEFSMGDMIMIESILENHPNK